MSAVSDVPEGWDCHVHVFDAVAGARGGHYQPAHHPLERIEALAASHGVGHLVLVQPSVYGTDNTLLLHALAREPGRHRGVVVLDDAVSEAELAVMDAHGVRGARLNLVSPVGEGGADPVQRFGVLRPRLRRLGWHLQWYAHAAQLPTIAALHRDSGLTCVLDHLAGFTPSLPCEPDHPAWQAVDELAAGGAWLKLSGWYRLASTAPHADLVPTIRRLAERFGDRLVWGSDWPHTLFAPQDMPPYAATWAPVVESLGPEVALALRGRWPGIYR